MVKRKTAEDKEREYQANPWWFNNEPFNDCKKYAGFVYEITDTETGKRYIGKKFFWSMKRVPSRKNRITVESTWREYYSSNDEIKSLVKDFRGSRFKRVILSIHELERDVNYEETRQLYARKVLSEVNEEGELVYYNGNIEGKRFSNLCIGIEKRSLFTNVDII